MGKEVQLVVFDSYQKADEFQIKIMNWYFENIPRASMARWAYPCKDPKNEIYGVIVKERIIPALNKEEIQGIIRIDKEEYWEWMAAVKEPKNLIHNFHLETSHGTDIIKISNNFYKDLIENFKRNPEELKIIDRRKFEELVAYLFEGLGFDVELTKKTRDGGRDIIAIKEYDFRSRYLIECKRPDPGRIIGVGPVRQLYGVLVDEKATKGILATTAFFSKDAKLFIERNKWHLDSKDYDDIIKWINTID